MVNFTSLQNRLHPLYPFNHHGNTSHAVVHVYTYLKQALCIGSVSWLQQCILLAAQQQSVNIAQA